ncbi:MAG: hypothetical protein ACI8SR_001041 [Oceanicoccus sp.]|jgi:hypothetical protein
MKPIMIASLCFSLSACQGLPQGDPDFYTWVDETGQIRTVKKKATKSSVTSITKNEKAVSVNDFDPNDFVASENIDKKLSDEKLFAWQDNTGAQIVVEELIETKVEADESTTAFKTEEINLKAFREGSQILFKDIDGVSISLERYYQFNQSTKQDYLLIELYDSMERIQVKSFVSSESVAMPQIIPLTAEFKQVYAFENPYQFREPESWYSYGYLYGELNIPKGSSYLLLLPNPLSGVIEAEEGMIIKQSNLGDIVLTLLK